jgi:hypothetical protein
MGSHADAEDDDGDNVDIEHPRTQIQRSARAARQLPPERLIDLEFHGRDGPSSSREVRRGLVFSHPCGLSLRRQ